MKRIAVLGLGQFGYQVAIGLTQKGFEVIALDSDVEIVTEIKDLVSKAVIVDTTDEKAMWSIDLDTVDSAIVAIGTNVQSSLLTTALLQRMDIRDIYVRAIDSLQESILKSMGITSIINIEKEMGLQLANTLSSGKVGRYIELSERHSLVEVEVPKSFVGKSLKALNLRSKYKVNIVGIKTRVPEVGDDGDVRYKVSMQDVPDPDYAFQSEDLLIISGTEDNLAKLIQEDRGL